MNKELKYKTAVLNCRRTRAGSIYFSQWSFFNAEI